MSILKTGLAACGWIGRYVWAGWAGLAGIFCFLAVWQFGHEVYGSFVLPSPGETLQAVVRLAGQPGFTDTILVTAGRSLGGFALSAAIGTVFGALAGYSFSAMRLVRPIMTVMLGVPPIGWIVLALIWFGATGGTAILTVVVASAPISFAGALEGVAKRDRQLDVMAQSFGASWPYRLRTIAAPQVLSYMFPAWTTTAGSAWKITVMAELLSNSGGIGGALANARALFDIAEVSAWLAITVCFALLTDYGFLNLVREGCERWRSAGLPAGMVR